MAENKALADVTFGTYYVRAGAEDEFEGLLARSWATLRRLGFVADETPTLYRSVSAPTRHLELTRWLPGVMDPAHEHPDVIPIGSKLGALLEPHTPTAVDRGLVFDEFLPVTLRPVA